MRGHARPVRGEIGGNIVQPVNARVGAPAGVNPLGAKYTKNWSDTWLSNRRDNKRAARGD
jgi:hypothetical protein